MRFYNQFPNNYTTLLCICKGHHEIQFPNNYTTLLYICKGHQSHHEILQPVSNCVYARVIMRFYNQFPNNYTTLLCICKGHHMRFYNQFPTVYMQGSSLRFYNHAVSKRLNHASELFSDSFSLLNFHLILYKTSPT